MGGESTAPLAAHDLRKSYVAGDGSPLHVLEGVNLRVERGEAVAIIGASGAGKSTLLHLLGALDLPTTGEVLLGGHSVAGLDEDGLARMRNRHVGFVFQFHHLLPELTALENVLMPTLIARQPLVEARKRAKELLDRVGLGERLAHHPGELSGGEQQRVALARALVMSPRVVLADEPTGNLDGRTAEEMHVLMEQLNAETGTSFVVVSHNHELASRMSRVLRMVDGRVLDETVGTGRAAGMSAEVAP